MTTAKVVKKFCFKTMKPYKQTLREVQAMGADERGVRLKAMKEFLANNNIGITDRIWATGELQQAQQIIAGLRAK